MHPEDIKAAIRKKGETQRSIASSLGISLMGVSHVIFGRQKSKRVAQAIAGITGLPIAQLFPGKYPELEFVARLGLTAPKAEADLTKLAAARKPAKKAAARRATA